MAAALLVLPSTAGAQTTVAWSGPIPLTLVAGVDTGRSLSAITCPSPTQCTAVGGPGLEVTFNPGSPAASAWSVTGAGNAIACPSVSQCTAVDNDGAESTFNPNAPPSTPTLTRLTSLDWRGVSCPSVTQCTAVGENGYEITFDPTAPATPSTAQLEAGLGLSDVACPSLRQCVAVGGGGYEITFDPRAPSKTTRQQIASFYGLGAVACPSVRQCTTIDYVTGAATFDPLSPTARLDNRLADIDGTSGVACPSLYECVVVFGDSGNGTSPAVMFDPTSPTSSTVSTVASRAPGLDAVACASVKMCVAIDSNGNAFVGHVTPGPQPCSKAGGNPSSPDYCVPPDWTAHTKHDAKTPGREPLNVIISARSNVPIDSFVHGALDFHESHWHSGCVSPEMANVTGHLRRQQKAWRRGGCAVGNHLSIKGLEDHIRLWSQRIPGTGTTAWFGTASYETACFVTGDPPHQHFFRWHDRSVAFRTRHILDVWHCIDGGRGSFGVNGYDHGAKTFVSDVRQEAAARGWTVTAREDHSRAGVGLIGVKYSDRVLVVTITKPATARGRAAG